MLPEFPHVYEHLIARVKRVMIHASEEQSQQLSGTRRIECFEGDSHGLTDEVEIPFKEFSEQVLFNKTELPDLSPEELIKRFQGAGKKLGMEKVRLFHEVMRNACESMGTVMNAADGTSIIEQIFVAMERTYWSFDEEGNPSDMSFFAGEALLPILAEAHNQIENTPELSNRKKALIEKKREVWRAAQANRKLVD